MRKTILTEIIIFVFIAIISVGLYHFIYGINLRCDNYLDLITFEARRTITVIEIFGIFILPIYLSLNILRQLYYKFLNRLVAFEILFGSVLLAGLLFYKYLFLSSDGVSVANEGWTIYPPLTGLSTLDEHDSIQLQNDRNILLIKIVAILTTSIVLTMVTFRRRKKH